MAVESRGPSIHVQGLAELRSSLRVLDRSALRDTQKGLRAAMKPVAADARTLAPHRSGDLARSLKPFAAGNSAGVRSRLPYAAVLHWGGTTGKGHRPGVANSGSVRIKPSVFVPKAVDKNEQQIIDAIGDVIEQHARMTGWR